MSSTEYIDPALKFNEKLYHPNDRGNMLLQFREQGFTILRDVFEGASVDPFLAQIESLIVSNEGGYPPLALKTDDPITVHPARAPRLLQVLRGAFMPWIDEPHVTLFHPSWLTVRANPGAAMVHDWHKDGDHTNRTTAQGYTYPAVVHTAMYFADMTPELGPTYVIPRSHRDPSKSPYAGTEESPFLPRKSDVVIWDQRLWHRASPRIVPGIRIAALFGFMPIPAVGQMGRTPAQLAALQSAQNDQEHILFGGPFRDVNE